MSSFLRTYFKSAVRLDEHPDEATAEPESPPPPSIDQIKAQIEGMSEDELSAMHESMAPNEKALCQALKLGHKECLLTSLDVEMQCTQACSKDTTNGEGFLAESCKLKPLGDDMPITCQHIVAPNYISDPERASEAQRLAGELQAAIAQLR